MRGCVAGCGCEKNVGWLAGRVRSKDVNEEGRGRFLDGEKVKPFYIKEKAGVKGKIFIER